MSVFHYVKNLSFSFFKKENQMDLKFRSFIGRYWINQEPERRNQDKRQKEKDKRQKEKGNRTKPPIWGVGG
jgi:hypothetical protein